MSKIKKKTKSFDKLISGLTSLRSSLKGKANPFTRKEREELWKDVNRE